VALMYHITHSEGPPPLPEHMPPRLRSFLLRCFVRDPATRPSARELLSDPFLTQGDDVEEAGRDSGLDWLTRTSSGDGTLGQGDLSDWDVYKRAGGSGGKSQSSSGGTSARAMDDETFELLARALAEREKGQARPPSGSLGAPVTAEPPITSPVKDDQLVGQNLSRLPVVIGPERVSSQQAEREGASLWPMRATDAPPSSPRALTSRPLQGHQLSFDPPATSDKLPDPTQPRRRNKTRSDDLGLGLGLEYNDLSLPDERLPTSLTGLPDSGSFPRASLTHPRSPGAGHARGISSPHRLTGTLTDLPSLAPPPTTKVS
jgi:serine/threonine protein kinase